MYAALFFLLQYYCVCAFLNVKIIYKCSFVELLSGLTKDFIKAQFSSRIARFNMVGRDIKSLIGFMETQNALASLSLMTKLTNRIVFCFYLCGSYIYVCVNHRQVYMFMWLIHKYICLCDSYTDIYVYVAHTQIYMFVWLIKMYTVV